MIRQEEAAQIVCRSMVQNGRTIDEIMTALELEFGDNFAQLQRGVKTVIAWVYEDSRPNYELYTFPTGKKG